MAIDILVIDDEEDIRNGLCNVLEDEGYEARSAKNSDEALQAVVNKKPKLVVLDIWLNNSTLDGIEILEELKKMYKELPVIIISGHGTVDMAVTATKKGAYDFLSKPFKTDALLTTIFRALESERLVLENKALQDKVGVGDFSLIGDCKEINVIKKSVEKYADLNVAVLIVGESGTGKDVVASLLHEQSSKAGSFKVFNALSENKNIKTELFGSANPRRSGLIEEASGGTIVIDNVEKLKPEIQMELSNVIGSGKMKPVGSDKTIPLTARIVIICREKNDIDENLMVRLKNNIIKMPRLVDRLSDIENIAVSFMEYRSKAKGAKSLPFDASAFVALSNHDWKGNMWEFVNVIDRLLLANIKNKIKAGDVNQVLSGEGQKENMSFDNVIMQNMRDARASFEKYYLSYHLHRLDGNVTQTARFVGMDRASLSRKLKLLGLN